MDPELSDALLAAGIITADQAERLRAELERRHEEKWGPMRDAILAERENHAPTMRPSS